MHIRQISARLMALYSDRIAEVEDRDMDEGRFFVHLKAPWHWDEGNGPGQRTRSFANLTQAKAVLKTIQKEA